MHDVIVVLIKALFGGLLVTLFALVGHVLRTTWFAGLFGAAPSVAIVSLAVRVLDKGNHHASLAAHGMVFGAAGVVAFRIKTTPPATGDLAADRAAAEAALLRCSDDPLLVQFATGITQRHQFEGHLWCQFTGRTSSKMAQCLVVGESRLTEPSVSAQSGFAAGDEGVA